MIKLATPIEEIDKMIEDEIRKSEKKILTKLSYIGESAVSEARSNGDYIDQTGNLRSSIGYVILKNGKTVFINVRESNKGSDKKTGLKAGENAIKELSQKYKDGYVLVVVAGMDYAVYVEALGRNVLSSSKLLAESLIKQL